MQGDRSRRGSDMMNFCHLKTIEQSDGDRRKDELRDDVAPSSAAVDDTKSGV